MQVSGLSGVTSISAGNGYSLALKNDGTVWAWGFNGVGELGDGTTMRRTTPVQVSRLHDVVAIAAGPDSAFALKTDGKIYAWGSNNNLELGIELDVAPFGFLTNPEPVVNVSNAVAVAAGSPSVALTANGSIYAWGRLSLSFPYQLNQPIARPTLNAPLFSPDGGTYSAVQTVTVNLPSAPASLKSVALGGSHSVAVMSDGKVYAWGINDGGQIGLPGPFGAANYSPLPVLVNGVDSVKAAAGGDGHSLALRTDGTVWAWGRDDFGQSGTGGSTTNVPAPVLNLSDIKAISASFAHSIAVSNQGTVWVWGTGIDGTQTTQFTPIQVAGLSDVMAVAAGSGHNVALKNDGTVWTWGANGGGELCDSTVSARSTPAMVAGVSNITAIGAGDHHSAFLRSDGTVPVRSVTAPPRNELFLLRRFLLRASLKYQPEADLPSRGLTMERSVVGDQWGEAFSLSAFVQRRVKFRASRILKVLLRERDSSLRSTHREDFGCGVVIFGGISGTEPQSTAEARFCCRLSAAVR